MAGRFLKAKYESDSGVVYNIRIQPETVFDENLEPTGAVTGKGTFRVTGSKRAYGMKARYVTLARSVGTDADYSGGTIYARIPVLKKASVDTLVTGSTVTYQDVAWVVGEHFDESIR